MAVQDFYPDDVAHCYGCGRLNSLGLHIRSEWEGEETIATLMPRPEHTAIPGYVYGGLIASLIDCHGTGSAALAAYRAENREPGSDPALRFVTASLHVDFVRPTPMGVLLHARGRIAEIKPRKVIVDIEVRTEAGPGASSDDSASMSSGGVRAGETIARGRVVAVKMPASFGGGAQRGGSHIA